MREVEFTDDLAEMTDSYVVAARELIARAVFHRVEWRVDVSMVYAVPDQFGTADLVLIFKLEDGTYELMVLDLKTGWKYVEVESNAQLMIYALGALAHLEVAYDISSIRLGIFAPRHGGMHEWSCSVEELQTWGVKVQAAAQRVEQAAAAHRIAASADDWATVWLNSNPNEDECAFCPAMSTCPAMRAKIEKTLGVTFAGLLEGMEEMPIPEEQDDTALREGMKLTGLLEDWSKATRAEMERRLMAGANPQELEFGLELGRQGNRAWKDSAKVEAYLKNTVRLTVDDMYTKKLKGPKPIELLVKAEKLGATQWKKLQADIHRSDPVPSVKPLAQIKTLWNPNPPNADDMPAVDEDAPL